MTIHEYMQPVEANDPEHLVWELECLLKTMVVSCDTDQLLEALDNSSVNELFAVLHRKH